MSETKQERDSEREHRTKMMKAFFILGAAIIGVALFPPFEAAQRLHVVSAIAFFAALLLKPVRCTCE